MIRPKIHQGTYIIFSVTDLTNDIPFKCNKWSHLQIWNDKAEIRRHSFKASYYADLDGHSCLRFVVLKDFHFWGCCYYTYLLTYVYSYKLFTLDSFLHYMLPQRSKAHMHTPILIFFTCIAKKQISKLHNIVLLHKKIKP